MTQTAILEDRYKEIFTYPDSQSTRLKKQLAVHYKLFSNQVVVGRNTSELLELFLQGIRPKDVMIAEPAPRIYRERCALNNIRTHSFLLDPIDWNLTFEALFDALYSQVDCLILSNPVYTTTDPIPQEVLWQLVQKIERKNLFLVLDESCLNFREPLITETILAKDRRIFIMRSMYFKNSGSLCFGLGARRFIEKIQECQMNYSVSSWLEASALQLLG